MNEAIEKLVRWDDEERKACRREWEQRICLAIDEQVEEGELPSKAEAEYEAGLAVVRELRRFRRMAAIT